MAQPAQTERQVGYDPLVHARERARKAEQRADALERQVAASQGALNLTVYMTAQLLGVRVETILQLLQALLDEASRLQDRQLLPEPALTEPMMRRYIAQSRERQAAA